MVRCKGDSTSQNLKSYILTLKLDLSSHNLKWIHGEQQATWNEFKSPTVEHFVLASNIRHRTKLNLDVLAPTLWTPSRVQSTQKKKKKKKKKMQGLNWQSMPFGGACPH